MSKLLALLMLATTLAWGQTCQCPPPVITPPPVGQITTTVYVVPLRYKLNPISSQATIDAYNKTLPIVTQAVLQPIMDKVAAWYLKATFGVRKLNITVLPERETGTVLAQCDQVQLYLDSLNVLPGKPVDVVVGVTPYNCWQSQGATSGTFVAGWGTVTDGAAMYAHEIGHALGLGHAGSMVTGTLAVYGSSWDQMGRGSDFYTLVGFGADHLYALKALTPLPCQSATLRSIQDYPDAIFCGAYTAVYMRDWKEVWISKREIIPNGRGDVDTTDYAHLAVGQSYTGSGYTYKNLGNGQVEIK